MRRRPAVAVGGALALLLGVFGACTPVRADDFDRARKAFLGLVKDHRRTAGKTATRSRREQSAARVVKALEVALDPQTSGPGVVRRLRGLLPALDSIEPVQHYVLYDGVHRAFGAAIERVTPEEFAEFDTFARGLWHRSRKRADNTGVQRMVVASHLRGLVEKTAEPGPVRALVRNLLEREAAWIKPSSDRAVSVGRAIQELAETRESPTMYPILDAVEVVYEYAFDSDPYPVLEPLVTALIDVLRRVEIRAKVASKDGRVEADGAKTPTQTRLWYRLNGVLHHWTGEVQTAWYADWKKLWDLYFGPDRVSQQQFDFRKIKEGRDLGTRGTVVVRKRPELFGVEAKTSKIMLILDVSGSMQQNRRGVDRLKALKKEAIRFVTELQPGVRYNVLPFSKTASIDRSLSGGPGLHAKKMARGQIDSVTSRWIEGLPSGGTTRVDLAFRAAFLSARGGRPEFTELYFITDGSPTDPAGNMLDPDGLLDLLKEIRGLNARHRVIIHTIGFYGAPMGFLGALARENGGTARRLPPLKRPGA